MHGDGPMLVTAGPGSGKTTVITYRIHHLIHSLGISPEKILVITFTKAAAKQMKERFTFLEQNRENAVVFSTFHAFFYHIIKIEDRFNQIQVISESQKRNIMTEMVRKVTGYRPQTEFVEELLRQISFMRNQMIPLDEYSPLYFNKNFFLQVYQSYTEYMKNSGKVDFDDMLLDCLSLLKSSEDVLKRWQDRYDYYLVDEFQDINPLQYCILRLLTQNRENIFCVGDEDQSIYGFRGASPETMFLFLKDYKNVNHLYMTNNYRSDKKIVSLANKIIQKNKKRFHKEVFACKKYDDYSLTIKKFADTQEEYKYIFDLLKEFLQKYKPSEIAVLFRTNNIPSLFYDTAKHREIYVSGSVDISNRLKIELIKDIYAYFMLSEGVLVSEYFLRILEKPTRYLPKEMFGEVDLSWDSLFKKVSGKFYETQQLTDLQKQLFFIRDMPVHGAFIYIRKGIGYEEYLKNTKRKEWNKVSEILDELQKKSKEYSNLIDWIEYLEGIKDYDKRNNEQEQNINILTVHAAKGLEWDCVIIPDINEGEYPFHRAKTESEFEEERRIFYVGLTRAKKHLVLTSVNNRYSEIKPSVYFEELML